MQQVDKLIADLNSEIARENAFLGRERTNRAAVTPQPGRRPVPLQ